ncbi:sulfite exporter TauE/SafE family protein [bacterium]|nr:sulfite exporter TauE/SafE family protein [bacterium]
MSPEISFITAFMMGLLGSSHCVVMCGGLCAAIGVKDNGFLTLVLYNVGRLLSYSLLGLLMELVGTVLIESLPDLLMTLRVLSGALLIVMGLYISRLWMGAAYFERIGIVLWRRLQPLNKGLLPIDRWWKVIAIGVLWGFLPCGLVYSALAWSMTSVDVMSPSLLMLCFGLGTVPAMLSLGWLGQAVMKKLQSKQFRLLAGTLVVLMGVATMATPLIHMNNNNNGSDHSHHH